MLHLKNFIKYFPVQNENNSDIFHFINVNNVSIVFYQDETGRDWYDSLSSFEKDTIKIAYDKKGVVRDFNQDASAIVPDDLSVIEMNSTELPKGFDRLGNWMVDNGSIISSPVDYVEKATIQKADFLREANENIEIIRDAESLGIVTDAEKKMLAKWKAFRVLVSRIDVNVAQDIIWPTAPNR